ncbi:MAG: type IV pilus assembly protein PilE [Halioglobus sp.]|jgi:type IV pilus assembly protein PilE
MNYRGSVTTGFTLIELMMVIAILAILLMTVLPSYQAQLTRTARIAAQSELLQVVARQEHYFVLNRQYAETLNQLGYPSGPYAIGVDGEWLTVDSNKRIYLINLSKADGQAFTVSAIPQLSQSRDTRCGTLQINDLGAKAPSNGSYPDCW